MNSAERKALAWLCTTKGYKESDIRFKNNDSPDFLTPDGQGFEVKRIHKPTANRRVINIYPRQWHRLLQMCNTFFLLWGDGDSPEGIIPVNELPIGTKRWGSIVIRSCETNRFSVPRKEYLQRLTKRSQMRKQRACNASKGKGRLPSQTRMLA